MGDEWNTVSSDFNDGDFTFNLANGTDSHGDNNHNHGDTNLPNIAYTAPHMLPTDLHNSKFCVKCRTMAKMAVGPAGGSDGGSCLTPGCPGYTGHAPSPRVRHAPLESSYDDDESSDDVPLLFSNCSPSLSAGSSQELADVDHCHVAEPRREVTVKARRQLSIACVLCLFFVIGEVLGGHFSNSLAIMTDAAHMFSDFASFGVSLFVLWLSDKKPRKSMTFGYYRAEAMGALFTVVILIYVTGILLYMSIQRIITQDFEIVEDAMMAVAGCAILFNILLGSILHGCLKVPHSHSHGGGGGGGSHGHSHHSHDGEHEDQDSSKHINIRAALIHVFGDLLQSVGVLISSIIIKIFPGCKVADPICTIIFSIIVLCTTTIIIRDSVKILIEGSPKHISYDSVHEDLLKVNNVYRLHNLHIWSLTMDRVVLSVHLAVSPEADKEQVIHDTNRLLRSKYRINKSTIQVELYKAQVMSSCLQCQPLLV